MISCIIVAMLIWRYRKLSLNLVVIRFAGERKNLSYDSWVMFRFLYEFGCCLIFQPSEFCDLSEVFDGFPCFSLLF